MLSSILIDTNIFKVNDSNHVWYQEIFSNGMILNIYAIKYSSVIQIFANGMILIIYGIKYSSSIQIFSNGMILIIYAIKYSSAIQYLQTELF